MFFEVDVFEVDTNSSRENDLNFGTDLNVETDLDLNLEIGRFLGEFLVSRVGRDSNDGQDTNMRVLTEIILGLSKFPQNYVFIAFFTGIFVSLSSYLFKNTLFSCGFDRNLNRNRPVTF